MAKIAYEQTPTQSPGKSRYSRVKFPGMTAAGRRKFMGIKSSGKTIIRPPGSTWSPAKSVPKSPEAGIGVRFFEFEVIGEVIKPDKGAAAIVARRKFYSPIKIQKNVCQYGALQQRESKTWSKVQPNWIKILQPREEAKQQRDYDTVASESQHLLDQKFAGRLNQQQERKLQVLKAELDEFGEERFRRISQSQEYREFKQALQVLQEFNKNISAMKNTRRR
jgi:hypothetical protein